MTRRRELGHRSAWEHAGSTAKLGDGRRTSFAAFDGFLGDLLDGEGWGVGRDEMFEGEV